MYVGISWVYFLSLYMCFVLYKFNSINIFVLKIENNPRRINKNFTILNHFSQIIVLVTLAKTDYESRWGILSIEKKKSFHNTVRRSSFSRSVLSVGDVSTVPNCVAYPRSEESFH